MICELQPSIMETVDSNEETVNLNEMVFFLFLADGAQNLGSCRRSTKIKWNGLIWNNQYTCISCSRFHVFFTVLVGSAVPLDISPPPFSLNNGGQTRKSISLPDEEYTVYRFKSKRSPCWASNFMYNGGSCNTINQHTSAHFWR